MTPALAPAAHFHGRKIRVLVVDDSAIVRKLASDALNADPEIEVVGTAIDPFVARDKIVELEPDVLTLDIEMPRMDGITFLKILMKHHPMPIVIMSSVSQKGSANALDALEAGAVDVIAKPGTAYSVGDLAADLVRKVKSAYAARHRFSTRARQASAPGEPAAPARLTPAPGSFDSRTVIMLGASTGGTEALKEVLIRLPANTPPICIVQHIPAYFSGAFARRLNEVCAMEVREACDGDEVRSGLALVAPGDYHMLLSSQGGRYIVRLKQGPQVWHQRPAVDIFFQSAVPLVGSHAVAGVLTGMGQDGAKGLLDLRNAGARTFVQDEASCVVFGMPNAAMKLGGAEKAVSLLDIPRHILALSSNIQCPTRNIQS
ncbi:MAG: chemotaxis response regulator protein-glutamate methylesterase [Verrucomicrobiota bacterium]